MTGSIDVRWCRGAAWVACAALGTSISLAGCASPPPPQLAQARSAYDRAAGDADVSKYASVELYEAQSSVERAESDWAAKEDSAEAIHLAYLASRRVEIAEVSAAGRKAFEEMGSNARLRDKVALEATKGELARTKEAAAEREREMRDEIQEMQARETERGLLMTLGDVVFDVGEANLRPGATEKLALLARFLQDHPDRELLVEGYTDNTGSDSLNLTLSQERAESVTQFLSTRGISSSRMIATGYGKAYPQTSNDTPEGRQQNRRVEIVILSSGQHASEQVRARQ
jgi:OOP family OmpA-OmpF porin